MSDTVQTVALRQIAHGRTGDKGDRSNISVICRDPLVYPLIEDLLTEERVREVFSFRNVPEVRRYALPRLFAFNFVLEKALAGGVNRSLMLDRHGKGLSSLLLDQPIEVPADILARIGK